MLGSHTNIEYQTFKGYILNNRFNYVSIGLGLFTALIMFITFKYFYPFAGFINGDSYSYIGSAFYNLRVDVYPIGYPKFIRLFSVFTYNDTCLVAFQYFSIIITAYGLLFSIFYFYNPLKWIKLVLVCLVTVNPVHLYVANYVSSDSLFLSLSLVWFTLLIWIIQRPTLQLVCWHAIIILVAFMVRYNALFYPFISLLAFFSNRKYLAIKLFGVAITISILFLFINYTSNQFKRVSGTRQFSPFSGWQIANNALYAYRFIDSANRVKLPEMYAEIDNDVRNYFDSTRDIKKNPQEMLYASTVYMWDEISPLRIYMNKKYKIEPEKSELVGWSKVAPLYKRYGTELIKTYPSTFAKYYLFPNFLKYYVPPIEFLGSYSMKVDTVPAIARQWFWYRSNKLSYKAKDMTVNTLNYYPIVSAVLNVLFITMAFAFVLVSGKKSINNLNSLWILVILFWLMNLVFSVFASPIALRFQLFPFTISMIFIFIFFDSIVRSELEKTKRLKETSKTEGEIAWSNQ